MTLKSNDNVSGPIEYMTARMKHMSVMPLIDKGISPLGIVTSQGVESGNSALLVVRSKGIISAIIHKLQREHDVMETLHKQGMKQQSTDH